MGDRMPTRPDGSTWDCGVTIKAIRDGGLTWSIAVPAFTDDDERQAASKALDAAVDEALRLHRRLRGETTH